MTTYRELEFRYDGPIPRDEIDRANGLDPALMEAMGAVKFWRERVENAEATFRGTARKLIPMALAEEAHARSARNLTEAQAAFARAEARLRVLENPETAATRAVLDAIEGKTP